MRFYGYNTGGRPVPREREIVRIGDARGRIALYLDKDDAIDMANFYGPADSAYDELMAAVSEAYPEPVDADLIDAMERAADVAMDQERERDE